MKRADAVLNQVCCLAINYHKTQTNVEMSCQAAYPLEQPLTTMMSTLRTCTSHAEEEIEGVIIIEAFSYSCRSGQHGVSSLHQCVLNVASENKYCQYSRIALMPVVLITSINTSSQSTTTSSCRSVCRHIHLQLFVTSVQGFSL
ncbi:hypothetical protein Tsp_03426, partial [Trichinella spiralis]|uniref:hypothetical protein n=1 Tax=Trichinella spiralis TaxID=6334 RepID=UPI0001EFCF9B